MIKLKQAVIVEGKYDKIKLSSIIDAVIIVTNGFGIFKDKEKLALIRFYAESTGIIILTDSDRAGFVIRNHIKGAVKNGIIKNVYIPEILGKEKRKQKPSAEGKLGVEGMNEKIILEAFEKAGITSDESERKSGGIITKTDLYMLGLSGGKDSSIMRKRLLEHMKLPSLLSANSMLEVLNTVTDIQTLKKIMNEEIKTGG
ncbi:MAG: toprim domain-containing protein [Porcipelethomonas sp.]